jgi:tetratricopeptide (TPR) repeat protein
MNNNEKSTLTLMRESNDLEARGDYAAALDAIDNLIDREPSEHLWLTKRGNHHRILGDYKQAKIDYTAALNLHRRSATYMYRAECYYWLGDYQRARDDFDSAIKMKPTYNEEIRILYGMGLTLDSLGNTNEALEYLKLVIDKDKFYHSAYLAISELLEKQGYQYQSMLYEQMADAINDCSNELRRLKDCLSQPI